MADPTQLDDQDGDEPGNGIPLGEPMSFDAGPETGVTDTDDGGAIVDLDATESSGPKERSRFYDNLATTLLDAGDLAHIDQLLRPLIEQDAKTREKRDKDYAEAIKRTGIGGEEENAAFSGASSAVHPALAKASVDFEGRMILELFPSKGPVKSKIVAKATQQRVDRAERVSTHMNWQLTKQLPEFRGELEQLLSQLPLAGSQFLYGAYDEELRRPKFTYWPQDHVYVPASAGSVLGAERVTMLEIVTERVYQSRVDSGMYIDSGAGGASAIAPELTEAARAAAKADGVEEDPYNLDGLRPIWRCFTYLDLSEKDELADGRPAPYVIEMDALSSGSVKRVVRNWDQLDKKGHEPINWLVEFPFIPWRGAMSIGLGQAIGRLAGAASGAMRALLDAALVNNFPGMMKLKGANLVGQTQNVGVGMVVEMEGGVAGTTDDIRKLVMPIPYNQPSPVLQQLLGMLSEECEDFIKTTLRNITEDNANQMPVGTVLSILEEGLRTLNAIFARLHPAMGRVLQLLYRINALYLDEAEVKDETGEMLATKSDYNGPMEVEPVSDPNIFSESQRYAQMQLVAARAQLLPQLYDMRAVEEMILKRARIPDYDQLLLPAQNAQPNNAVNENVAMALGRPVAAFPDQDHLAHIQVHLDFMQSPMFGKNPVVAPKFLGGVLQHLVEHMVMWYASTVVDKATEAAKAAGSEIQNITELMDSKNHEVSAELDRLLATLSPEVAHEATQVFAQLPPLMQQAQQMLQQLSPQMPQDPTLAATQMQVQAKAASDQAATQRTQMTTASAEKRTAMQLQGKGQELQAKGQEKQSDTVVKFRLAQMAEEQETARAREAIQAKHQDNTDDNATAMQIAAAEIAAGKHSALSTGTGINPGGN